MKALSFSSSTKSLHKVSKKKSGKEKSFFASPVLRRFQVELLTVYVNRDLSLFTKIYLIREQFN